MSTVVDQACAHTRSFPNVLAVQADLFNEGFEPEEKPKKVEVQRTKKELTLEDFF